MTADDGHADAALVRNLRDAERLLEAARRHDQAAIARFKWEHPGFRDLPLRSVRPDDLTLADARRVVAGEEAFETWEALASFVARPATDEAARRFETAADAVVGGDSRGLENCLREDPRLTAARSRRRHRATLLHYLGANGVEGRRQRTSREAPSIARQLLAAEADVNALADFYGERYTTLSLVVSSAPLAKSGVQIPLVDVLLEHGAALKDPGTAWPSVAVTALVFGYLEAAKRLARHMGDVRDLITAAGLGRLEDVRRLLPSALPEQRHAALALAAQHNHAAIVELLLDSGEDPNRSNPKGYHAHATPLHQAALAGHEPVVRLLVERGARVDIRDTIYESTPLQWAEHGGQISVARCLRSADDDGRPREGLP